MISSNFDDKKFKEIVSSREEWIDNAKEVILDDNNSINDMADNNFMNRKVLKIKEIVNNSKNVKTLVFVSDDGNSLPLFKAGQEIALTLRIDNKFITRSYHICSTPSLANEGMYKIIICNNGDAMNNYFFNYAKVGDIVVSSHPYGDFTYNSIRDKKNIIAIVGDEGIAPIYSMGESLVSGDENFNLTIFYSAKKKDDLIYFEELDELDKRTSRIKVIYVLSEQIVDGMLTGFVSLDKIKNYYNDDTTIFISGNEGLLKYLDRELDALGLPKKDVRYDSYMPRCNVRKSQEYNLTIFINDVKYETKCYNNKTIMSSIEESGIFIPSKCHKGSCGFCKSELVLGKVKIVNDKRTKALKEFNYIHPCVTYPMSDIEIIVR
ncbi:MAG: 2Fe-2S iron-sulfur cluster-binding protein [Candidatus Coprovivens sp.]